MKQNLRLIIFVLILGLFTSGILVGVDALTRDRIKQNEAAQLKGAILAANDESYNFGNIHDVFDDVIEIIEVDDLTFYEHKTTGYISYEYTGGGVWGPISGIITLESDFETIVAIKVLQQEETPGLGGIIAEAKYLANFVGIKMTPTLEINKDSSPNLPNEVDAITGATRTSSAFEKIMNDTYQIYKAAWESRMS
ncbi:MAG: FMN-binding protein [Acholeplasmataceae bacterium]|jgi:Na+-transporting NADH:ubiquinone oxidoreductase subunit C|nr:FMN-binding protein [Acholeplasmataceae bacterium]